MSTIESACGRRNPHAPHTETGTMLGAYYSHNCGGLVVEPRPDYVLRLTGEQIDSIDPPPDGDWFTDWDEYEDFVPRRMLDAATGEVERLREALRDMTSLATDGAARQHLDRSGVMQDPPHGRGVFRECRAAWCVRNQNRIAEARAALGEEAGRADQYRQRCPKGGWCDFRVVHQSLDRCDKCGRTARRGAALVEEAGREAR